VGKKARTILRVIAVDPKTTRRTVPTSEPTFHKHVVDLNEDDHVFVWIKRKGRPDISIDLHEVHGRYALGVRTGGMSLAHMLVDVEPLKPLGGEPVHRFCPFCGDEINIVSSKTHVCKDKGD
jgi:hypothetical protein